MTAAQLSDKPLTDKLMLVANSHLTAVVDESPAVAVEPLTRVADKLSAVEPMHNIDNRMFDTAESVSDAELLAVVDVEPLAVEPIPVHDGPSSVVFEPMIGYI